MVVLGSLFLSSGFLLCSCRQAHIAQMLFDKLQDSCIKPWFFSPASEAFKHWPCSLNQAVLSPLVSQRVYISEQETSPNRIIGQHLSELHKRRDRRLLDRRNFTACSLLIANSFCCYNIRGGLMSADKSWILILVCWTTALIFQAIVLLSSSYEIFKQCCILITTIKL